MDGGTTQYPEAAEPGGTPPPSWLRLWFGKGPVSQRAFVLSGFGLMAGKYFVEVLCSWIFFDVFFDPSSFLFPSLAGRREMFGESAGEVAIVWSVWTLPFVWIAFSMTVRRALRAGYTPWLSVLIFVPVVNLLFMLAFAMAPDLADVPPEPILRVPEPEIPAAPARTPESPVIEPSEISQASSEVGESPQYEYLDNEEPPPNFVRFFVAFALCLTVAGGMLAVAVYGAGQYAAALFFGTPMVMGMIVSVFCYEPLKPKKRHLGQAVLSVTLAFLILLAVGFEGAICVLMAFPMGIVLALLGAMLGHGIVDAGAYPRRQIGLAILALPVWLGVEVATKGSEVLAVTTSVTIDAPIERVWSSVVEFPDIDAPQEWFFRMGIACPLRARIEGTGVSAVRHCVFTTGTFVEPITVWDEPTHLAFDVREQPAPMFELSPYADLHPPHLDGALRSLRGEFRMTALGAGRTRLSGTTWYEFDMYPRMYWVLWSDWLIHAIHRRVLEHIADVAENGR